MNDPQKKHILTVDGDDGLKMVWLDEISENVIEVPEIFPNDAIIAIHPEIPIRTDYFYEIQKPIPTPKIAPDLGNCRKCGGKHNSRSCHGKR